MSGATPTRSHEPKEDQTMAGYRAHRSSNSEGPNDAGQPGRQGRGLRGCALLACVLVFLLLIGATALVAVIRVPAADLPAVVRGLGTWWHLDLRL